MVSRFFTSGKHRQSPSCPPASTRQGLRNLIKALTLALRSHIWEAIRLVWPESHWASDSNYAGIESRL